MKKITIATVLAGAALSGFCLESSNIVGFKHNATEQGFRMISGAGFGAIGNQRGFWISSITPFDYHENEDMWGNGGTSGQFNIQMLSSEGKVVGTYMWNEACDGYDPAGWNGDGHWNNVEGDEIIPGSDNDTFIPASAGLYFYAPSTMMDADPTKPYYPISQAGQIDLNDLDYTFLANGGFQCLGNPFPVAIKLSSIIPVGYHENEDMWGNGGTSGQFNIQMLSNEGKVIGTYIWNEACDGYDPAGWNDDGHWNDTNGDPIPGDGSGKNDLAIEPGMGVYFSSPMHMGDEGNPYTVTFKYPTAK